MCGGDVGVNFKVEKTIKNILQERIWCPILNKYYKS